MRRYVRSFAALATLMVAFACGGPDGPTAPVGPKPLVCTLPQVLNSAGTACITPPAPSFVGISVEGKAVVEAWESPKYDAYALYSDGTKTIINSSADWVSSNPFVGDVNQSGILAPANLGDLQLTVSWAGRVGTLGVRVVGTPWSRLPTISSEAKAWIKSFVLNDRGQLWRWKGDGIPVTVWASASFARQKIDDAIAFWSTNSDQKLKFTVVSDSAQAQIVFTTDLTGLNTEVCGYGGATMVERSVMLKGAVRIKPTCANEANTLFTHELGHTLAFLGHTPGGDPMGATNMAMAATPFLTEIIRFVYTVPPGTIIIE